MSSKAILTACETVFRARGSILPGWRHGVRSRSLGHAATPPIVLHPTLAPVEQAIVEHLGIAANPGFVLQFDPKALPIYTQVGSTFGGGTYFVGGDATGRWAISTAVLACSQST